MIVPYPVSFKRLVLTLLIILLSSYLIILLVALLTQKSLIYHPDSGIDATPAGLGLDYREVFLQSSDGTRFCLWQIPGEIDSIAVLFFHGNAGNISHRLENYRILHSLGVTIYAIEYRGYGKSSGKPSEKGIDLDLRALSSWLDQEVDRNRTKLIAMGQSLGGAVALKLASIYPIDGLILESTFASMVDVGRKAYPWLPVGLLLCERYDSRAIIPNLHCPVMVMHSPTDEVIPYRLGRALYHAINAEKYFVELEGSHNEGFLLSEKKCSRALAQFFDGVQKQQ